MKSIIYKGATYREAAQDPNHVEQDTLGGFQIETYKFVFCSYHCSYLAGESGETLYCRLLSGHYDCVLSLTEDDTGQQHPYRCPACFNHDSHK